MMKFGLAVMYRGKRYDRINAIISRQFTAGEEEGCHRMQAELYEGSGNSVTVVPVSELDFVVPPAETASYSTANGEDPADAGPA